MVKPMISGAICFQFIMRFNSDFVVQLSCNVNQVVKLRKTKKNLSFIFFETLHQLEKLFSNLCKLGKTKQVQI